MGEWVAEITNNPEHDRDLYVELLEDDAYKARVEMSETGALVLRFYPSSTDVVLPVAWLMPVLAMAQKELQPSDSLVP